MTEPKAPASWQEVMEQQIDLTKVPEYPPGYARVRYSADAKVVDGQLKVGHQRQHEFFCDEPPSIGGQDRYPQPLAYFAAGMGF